MADLETKEALKEKIRELEAVIAEKDREMALLRGMDLRLKAMVEAFEGLIYVCSSDYRVEYLNEQYIKRIGWDATGEICYRALHNRESICPWCLNERIFSGETVRCEVMSHRNRWYHVVSTPIYHPDGSVSKHAMIIDITDRKKAEEKLKESKQRLDLAMEATSDALWDWNLKTNKTYFNACFYTMLGYEPNELPQTFETWEALIHPEDKRAAVRRMRAYVDQKIGSFDIEYRLKTKTGGWRWILARGKVVQRDEKGTPIRMVGTHVDITERKLNEEALRMSEASLREENLRLKASLKGSNQFGSIIGGSRRMQEVYEIIMKAALSNANVIIYGESGTGKELVARTIHTMSARGRKRFVTVNCGAIPENLVESEFFGYRKGAFTGAQADKPGYLDAADGGTLFLDEIGELDLNMQVKLLRILEGGGYKPVGSQETRHPDVRIVAATNRDLKAYVQKGLVREDFYYRIHIIPIHLPPLRERKGDITLLIHHFLQKYSEGKEIPSIPENVMKSMRAYAWPGNVRELQNTIHRYVTLRELDFTGITENTPPADAVFPTNTDTRLRTMLENFEKRYIAKTLQEHNWHRSKVADLLGINRRTLFRKMREYGLN